MSSTRDSTAAEHSSGAAAAGALFAGERRSGRGEAGDEAVGRALAREEHPAEIEGALEVAAERRALVAGAGEASDLLRGLSS